MSTLASRSFAVLVVIGPSVVIGQTEPSCCEAEVNLGFSEVLVRGGAVFDSIVGLGEGCSAGEGEIVSEAPAGTRMATRVHVNIVSNLEPGNVQGWSYAVALDGAAEVRSLTVSGTAGDVIPIGYRDPECGFNKTQIVDPGKNLGQRGFVSMVGRACGIDEVVMPSVGTESVLAADIAPEAPQGAAEQVATLRFQNGLIGTGQPVDASIVVVNGDSAPICNEAFARVELIFRQSAAPELRRGDANGDARVHIADPIWILNELFLSGPESPCADAADADDDGVENISDAIYLLNFLFSGTSPAPPAPGPSQCGPDPTDDDLDCREVLATCP